MKERLRYLITFYAWFLLLFSLAKSFFILYNQGSKSYTLAQHLQTIIHGWGLDIATIGYLVSLPLLLLIVSLWIRQIPFRKIIVPYLLLISLLIAIILIVDASLYPFWQFKLDASIFNYLDSPKEAMASVSVGYILFRVLCILVIAGILFYPLYRFTPKEIRQSKKPLFHTLLFIPIFGVIFLGIRGGIGESTANVGKAYYCDNQFLNHSAVNPCFSLLYSLGKKEDFKEMYHTLPEEECTKLFEGLYKQETDNVIYLLNDKRPNILLIEWEGFGSFLTETLGGAKDVTPQFNKLVQEGIFFENYYSNSYRTDRGTISTLSGHLGLPNLSIMKLPMISQTLPSIAKTLGSAGYTSSFLYGGDINFTNMKSYLYSSGYSKLTSMDDFSLSQQKNAWGVNDDITFDWLYNYIQDQSTSQPWHIGFLTLSSHEPWTVPYRRLPNELENAFAFTDECLGKFIKKLKKNKIWDKTLIIIVPDHSCLPSDATFGKDVFFHCPMLWLGGAIQQPKRITTIMNQSDIAATLLSQLDLPIKDFKFSRNVLSKNYTYPFAFSCFNDGFLFMDSTGTTVYDNKSNKALMNTPSNTKREKQGKAILQRLYDDLANRRQ